VGKRAGNGYARVTRTGEQSQIKNRADDMNQGTELAWTSRERAHDREGGHAKVKKKKAFRGPSAKGAAEMLHKWGASRLTLRNRRNGR